MLVSPLVSSLYSPPHLTALSKDTYNRTNNPNSTMPSSSSPSIADPRAELKAQITTASVVVNDYHELLRLLQPKEFSVSGVIGSGDKVLTEEMVLSRASQTSDEVKQELRRRLAARPSPGVQKAHTSSQGATGVDIGTTYELCLDGLELSSLGGESSPLRQYTNLRKLSLQHNSLSAQSLSPAIARAVFGCLPELRDLQLGHNSIEKDAVLGAIAASEAGAKLETLGLPSNSLKGFNPVSPMLFARLTTLDLSHNKLTSFSSANLKVPCLTTLDLSYNELTSLAGATFTGTIAGTLEVLLVSGNRLTTLQGVENLPVLEELHASRNRLRYLPAVAHQNPLRNCGIRVRRTRMNSDGELVATTGLCLLDVSHNDVSSLSFFPPPSSKALENVWSLNLSNNRFLQGPSAEVDGAAQQGRGSTPPPMIKPPDDDIGEALYGEEDVAPTTLRPPSAISTKSSVLRGPKGRTTKSAVAKKSISSFEGSTRAGNGKGAEAASSFVARLAQIFPSVEALDIGGNGRSVVTSYNELRHLESCGSLTELVLEGTLDVDTVIAEEGEPNSTLLEGVPGLRLGMSAREKHLAAVRALLPCLTMLDGAVVGDALLSPEGGSRPGSRLGSSMRPQSALGGSRPGSAVGTFRPTSSKGMVVRDNATESEKITALQAARAKAERAQIVEEMQAILDKGIASRDRCQALRAHMAATVNWALSDGGRGGDAPEEPRPQLTSTTGPHHHSESTSSSDADDDGKEAACRNGTIGSHSSPPQPAITATPPRGTERSKDPSPRNQIYKAPPGSAPALSQRPHPIAGTSSTSHPPQIKGAFGTPQRAPSSNGKGGRLQPLARPASSDQAKERTDTPQSRLLPTGTSLAQTPTTKRSSSSSLNQSGSFANRKPASATFVPSVLRTMKERSATISSDTMRTQKGPGVDSGTSTVSPKTETSKRRQQQQQSSSAASSSAKAVASTSTATSPAKHTAFEPVVGMSKLALPQQGTIAPSPTGLDDVEMDDDAHSDGEHEGPYVGMQPGIVVGASDPRAVVGLVTTPSQQKDTSPSIQGGRAGRIGGAPGTSRAAPVVYTTTANQLRPGVPQSMVLKPRTLEVGSRPGSAGGLRAKPERAQATITTGDEKASVDPSLEAISGAATLQAANTLRSAVTQMLVEEDLFTPDPNAVEPTDEPVVDGGGLPSAQHPTVPTYFEIDSRKNIKVDVAKRGGTSLNARTRRR